MSEAASNEPLPEITNAEAEAQYRTIQPRYEKLAAEVEYILRDALVEERVPIVSLSKRVKSVASFADKLRRKSYKDPLTEVTDLAGVRIVSYFRGDLARLEYMIQRHFHVHDKVDKFAEKETDKFGYTAVHFIVSLKDSYYGARYNDLHDLICEIQTRAVLSDAWAVLDHLLVYKKEELPSETGRKVTRLAAILESAELQFEEVRREIEAFREAAKPKSGDEFLNQPINPTSVAGYIERMVPGIEAPDKEYETTLICSQIDRTRFRTLADIEDAVRRTKKAILALKKDTSVYPHQELTYALAFADTSMRGRFTDWFDALFTKHRHLVEEPGGSEPQKAK
jgi:ppGpp synthetase/RelA/SpoT-type nucleotidyltranferase